MQLGGNLQFVSGSSRPRVGTNPLNLIELPDGNIVVAGSYGNYPYNGAFPGFAVVELTKDGHLNDSFGNGGVSLIEVGPNSAAPGTLLESFVVNKDGTILLGGTFENINPALQGDFVLAELTADGRLDNSFGNGGETLVSFGSNTIAFLENFVVEPDGTIVLGGSIRNLTAGTTSFGVADLTKHGNLNGTFGTGGKTQISFGASPGPWLSDLAVQPNGNIDLVGWAISTTGSQDYAVVELTEDGILNNNFGTGGVTIISFATNETTISNYIFIRPDGTILVAGQVTDNTSGQVSWGVAELTAPLPKVKVNSIARLEGESGLTPFTFLVRLPDGGSSNSPVTYDVYTTDGTAKAGVNYVGITAGDTAHGGTVTFAQGSNWATVTVYVIAGSLEVTQGMPTATFTINFSDPANPGVPLASGTGTIIAQTAEAPTNIGSAANYPAAVMDSRKTEDGN